MGHPVEILFRDSVILYNLLENQLMNKIVDGTVLASPIFMDRCPPDFQNIIVPPGSEKAVLYESV